MFYNIVDSLSVPGQFEARETNGKPFVSKGGRMVYPSRRGLMIALTKAGHTFPAAPKAPKAPVERKLNLTEDQVVALHAFAKGLIDETLPKTDKTRYERANLAAKAAGFGYYGNLSKVANAIIFGRKPEEEKAAIKARRVERKLNSEARAQERATETGWDSLAANAVARSFGFPRYRAVKRALEAFKGPKDSREYRSLLETQRQCIAAATTASKAAPAPAPAPVSAHEEKPEVIRAPIVGKSGGASSHDELVRQLNALLNKAS